MATKTKTKATTTKKKMGRPVTVGADTEVRFLAPRALVVAVRDEAKRRGISAAALWREGATMVAVANLDYYGGPYCRCALV